MTKSNYSSRIAFSCVPTVFGPTENSAGLSIDAENPTLEPNMN